VDADVVMTGGDDYAVYFHSAQNRSLLRDGIVWSDWSDWIRPEGMGELLKRFSPGLNPTYVRS
jgi:hypothetical protein